MEAKQTQAQPSTLAAKIAAASIAAGKFVADKRNSEQGYEYISADAVLARGGDALARAGVAIIPSVTDVQISTTDRGANRSPRQDARVSFVMLVSDGTESREFTWFGFGSDYSVPDKAVYKAITSGHKYFIMKLLNIGAGNEDSEHDTSEEKVTARTVTVDAEANKIGARYTALAAEAAELGIHAEPADSFRSQDEIKKAGKELRAAVEAAKAKRNQ